MIYIIEIASRGGESATKEIEASSLRDAVRVAKGELRGYPQCHIVDIWEKGKRNTRYIDSEW